MALNKNSIVTGYKVEDPKLREVLTQIEKKADTQKSVKTIHEGITYSNINKVEENVLHIDKKNNKLTIRIGDDLYDVGLTLKSRQ